MGVEAEGTVPRQRRGVSFGTVVAGVVVGVVEVVFAVAFAALVFGGYLEFYFLDDGVGLFLGASAVTLASMAWRAGRRGIVGSLQATGAVLMAIVSAAAVVHSGGSAADLFTTAVAAILVATVLCGLVAIWLGARRRGDLIRFVPYPVVGGFLAGAGWLLVKGGIYAAAGGSPFYDKLGDLVGAEPIRRWAPALAFGTLMLIAVRLIKRSFVIPAAVAVGFVVFLIGIAVTGSSMDDVRSGGWLLGSFDDVPLWKTWTLSAVGGADWLSVLESWAAIVTSVFVATIAILFNVSAIEPVLDGDLDTNHELRDAGIVSVVSGALGGIPGFHSLSFTALAARMKTNARAVGLIAALVPLAAAVFGAEVVELIPRAIVGGVLVFLGLFFIVEWVWDRRHELPRLEYSVVWVILAGVIVFGFLAGVVLGLVLAVVLFAISYGRIELVREVPFGETYRSNVDRPAEERAELMTLGDRVQILRISGFVFFGSTSRLLERIRGRLAEAPPRFLVIDLRRVTGVDSSAVVSFVKVASLAETHGFEVIFTGASEPVRAQLARGGSVEAEGLVTFEPDLDHGLQRCEDALLSAPGLADAKAGHPAAGSPDGLPPALAAHLERSALEVGDVLIHQGDQPGDVYVLVSGRLGIETTTPEGTRMRLRTLRPGVVVGEITLYTGVARTADVVAENRCVVLRIGRDTIERLEAEEPGTAAMLHRWLATTLAERLTDSMRAFDVLLD
jgi:sulfate permease, SulP family